MNLPTVDGCRCCVTIFDRSARDLWISLVFCSCRTNTDVLLLDPLFKMESNDDFCTDVGV